MTINYDKQRALGYAGLALLRNFLTGKPDTVLPILQEIASVSASEKDTTDNNQQAMVYDIEPGYAIWSKTYDTGANILIQLEEPVVKSILKKFPPGDTLDAACGTGRYSIYLKSLGHSVTGVDISEDMLRLAKKKDKTIPFMKGNLNALPIADELFDSVVCGLALHYAKNVNSAIKELARVVRPGGYIVISVVHPLLVALGAHAEFSDKCGRRNFIKENVHWISTYIHAFQNASLTIVQCEEPTITKRETLVLQRGSKLKKKIISQALEGLPVAVIWVLKKSKKQ